MSSNGEKKLMLSSCKSRCFRLLLAPSIEQTHAGSNAEKASVRPIRKCHSTDNSIVSRYNIGMRPAKLECDVR